jgi:aspartate kinase
MLELASLGAKVLHPRAVEIARNYGMPLVVRSSWSDDPGTRVSAPLPMPRSLDGLELAQPVDAVEFDTNQAKVALLRIPDRPGIAARLFGELAQQALNVDLVIQSIHEGNTNDIAFTVTETNLAARRKPSLPRSPPPCATTSPTPAKRRCWWIAMLPKSALPGRE